MGGGGASCDQWWEEGLTAIMNFVVIDIFQISNGEQQQDNRRSF